ncbi:RpiR family transcriptional regulator [[Clostridium] cellulosi]|uniref:RpiR family transcriptional regulator n=1 Tax=[Clostridium] cellulosi TaxID=29343 RepID=A0A078KSR6_9FIRM|nr:RpiR family transcriptional regulator [[Clostridium] cellulosi]
MNKDLLSQIQSLYPTFSKGQKNIARFIIDHYEKAAFMTASKLGSIVGVSESTVVRFASELGYEGYPELQKSLQELTRSKLTSVQRIEVSTDRLGERDILEKVLNSDIEKIKKTIAELSRDDFNGAVNAIVNASKIYILGVRSASALANFLGLYFNYIFDHVVLINTTSGSEVFEQIMRINENDVVIGISFPRYSTRTVKALRFASDRGAKVIAITDSEISPIYRYATYKLIAKSDMASFVDSLVAPLSLINALIVAVGIKCKDQVYNTFSALERIWDEYGVYEKTDDENESDDENKE